MPEYMSVGFYCVHLFTQKQLHIYIYIYDFGILFGELNSLNYVILRKLWTILAVGNLTVTEIKPFEN